MASAGSGDAVPLDPTEAANVQTHFVAEGSKDIPLYGDVVGDRHIVNACKNARTIDEIFLAFAESNSKDHKKKMWSLRYGITEFIFTNKELFNFSARKQIIRKIKELETHVGAPAPKRRRGAASIPYYRMIDGVNLDSEVVKLCSEAHDGKSAGGIAKDDAAKVWIKLIDFKKITDAECWTLRYVLTEFVWTEAAFDWVFKQMEGRKEKNLPGKQKDLDMSVPGTVMGEIAAIGIDFSRTFIPETNPIAQEATEVEAPDPKMQMVQLAGLLIVLLCLGISAYFGWSSSLLFIILLMVFVTAKLDTYLWPDWKRFWL